MKYDITKLPGSKVAIGVVIPFNEFEPHLKKAASLVSEEIQIEGFRPGRAPYEIVARKVGEMRIFERAANLAIEKFYPEAMELAASGSRQGDQELIPVGRPEITVTKLAPGNDLEFKIKIAVLPVFELPDYKLIAKKIIAGKKEVIVSPEELEKALNRIADSRSSAIPVERPIKPGDLVEVNFEVRKGGILIEGGHSKNHPLVVGEGRFIPGFEDAIVGMQKEEEKSFDLKMPDDYHEKSLAGETLGFNVKIVLVKEKKTPELNDEFVKSLGKFSSLDELKKSVKEGMVFEKENKESERLRLAIADEVASKTKMDLPGVMLSAELDKMVQELKLGLENMRMKWEDYLAQIKKSEDDLRKEWILQAKRRVEMALCLARIAKLEKIEPSYEEVKKTVDKFLMQYGSTGEDRKNIDPFDNAQDQSRARREIDKEALFDYARGITRNEKVFEFLEKL